MRLPIRKVVALRQIIRDGEQFGACHFVSEALHRAYGWDVVKGCADSRYGLHIPHVWNRLPDGSIFDGTADQFDGYLPGSDLGVVVAQDHERYHEDCDCGGDETLDAQVEACDGYLTDCANRVKQNRRPQTPPWHNDWDWWDECAEAYRAYGYIPKELIR